MVKITPEEVKLFSNYLAAVCGLDLDQSKAYLLENRLGDLLGKYGCKSFWELYQSAKADKSHAIEQQIIDRITTQETLFFRDSSTFEMLKHRILPELIDDRSAGRKSGEAIPIRIWSAGCATGQELYSIAMVIKELLADLNGYDIQLLGTDISNRAVAAASYGEYNKFEVERGLSLYRLSRFFSVKDKRFKIRDELRAMVVFKKANLLDAFIRLGKFDIIFCRNVSIYLSSAVRQSLFKRLAKVLASDGYLVIGSTESLTNINNDFQPKRHLRSVYYQLDR